eukprot:COSAG02_NODE_35776_length_463_cov_1.568681_1_plen_98_part_10
MRRDELHIASRMRTASVCLLRYMYSNLGTVREVDSRRKRRLSMMHQFVGCAWVPTSQAEGSQPLPACARGEVVVVVLQEEVVCGGGAAAAGGGAGGGG